AEIDAGAPRERVADELGDILFVVANLARRLEVDPEAALRGTNAKFETRFRHVEARLAETGRTPADSTLEEMEAYWQEAKRLP
ncbi:MAG: MazG nucleotide pyrophosphohydrolase domain-containing protein, partial [Rhodospirillales bacterium]